MANKKRVVIEVSRRGRPGDVTQADLAVFVPPLVDQRLSESDAPAQAAALAVTAELASRDLLEGVEIVEPDIAFAVVDEDGRRTWLEAGMDGGLTQHSVDKISEHIIGAVDQDTDITGLSFAIVDEDGRRTWLEADADGKPTARALALIGAEPASAAALTLPVDDWAHWGDSLTAGTSGSPWPSLLAALTGKSHYNGGWGGQDAMQVAARQGGVPARLTLTANTIPASGAATVTAITRTPLSEGGSRAGDLAGIRGTLLLSGGVHTFTRAVAGEAVPIAAGEVFIPIDASAYRDRTVTIWAGRNGYSLRDPARLVADIRGMLDYLSPSVTRAIVMEIPPWVGEETGTANRTTLDAVNTALAAAFPAHWLPISTWLRTPAAATAAGITFTADDNTDIANGLTPRSLRADAGHLNTAGNTAVAARIYQEAQERGWL